MSNAIGGLWAGLGALAGGALGAYAGKYAAESRPRGYVHGAAVEDAMIVGGGVGSVLGAFLAGTVMGEAKAEEKPPPAVIVNTPAPAPAPLPRATPVIVQQAPVDPVAELQRRRQMEAMFP